MKKTKQASGGARLIASGRRPVMLGPTAEEHAILAEAAGIEHRHLTQFLIYHGLEAAKKILKKRVERS